MNIFALDIDPVKAAQAHCDKHVVKMILETAQILSTVWYSLPDGAHYSIPTEAYKPTHRNHPCVKWAGRSTGNYVWLAELGRALCQEFHYRYGHGHKTEAVIEALCLPPCHLQLGPLTPFELCMPEEFQVRDEIQSYRNYYTEGKAHLLTYRRRQAPSWLPAAINPSQFHHV